jgi:hypothetical protein
MGKSSRARRAPNLAPLARGLIGATLGQPQDPIASRVASACDRQGDRVLVF